MLRRAIELISRRVTLRRRLPASFGGGSIFVSPSARLKYWKPNLHAQERLLFDAAEWMVGKGDVAWDIGANCGIFAAAAAAKAGPDGRILAVEADLWLTNLILKTANSLPSHYAPIDVITVAVAEKLGFAEFAIAARSRAANFLVQAKGSTQTGGIRSTYRVLTVGLDTLLEISPPPKAIKMDIEGAEWMAFSASQKILTEVRPRILCEARDWNQQAMGDLFARHDYLFFDVDNPQGYPQRVAKPTMNSLYLPAEDPVVQQFDKA